jgi:hypothetical protein
MVIVIASVSERSNLIDNLWGIASSSCGLLAMTGSHFFIHSSTIRCNVPSACIAASTALISATS